MYNNVLYVIGDLPVCIPVNCGIPSAPDNGKVSVLLYVSTNEFIIKCLINLHLYSCLKNITKIKSKETRAQMLGEWT